MFGPSKFDLNKHIHDLEYDLERLKFRHDRLSDFCNRAKRDMRLLMDHFHLEIREIPERREVVKRKDTQIVDND